jgi:D-alanyl-D-alanine carboxypeptidase
MRDVAFDTRHNWTPTAVTVAAATPLHTTLRRLREKHALPALAAAVVSSQGVIDAGAVGVRRLDRPDPIQSGDCFHLGSLTKSLTAVMLATLVEEGRLSWQTTPLKVCPELSGYIYPSLRAITLEQLLCHSAGIAPFIEEAHLNSFPAFPATPREQRLAFSRWLLQLPPALPPGMAHLYSNAGYTIATALAEKVSGRSWETLMRERVFQPLALDSAGFGWPAGDQQPWGHIESDGRLTPHDPEVAPPMSCLVHPAGDIQMSLDDMARYLQAQLRGLQGEETLLRPATWQKLHQSHIAVNKPGAADLGYGLGWNVQPRQAPPGAAVTYHTGSAGAFFVAAWLRPQQDRALVVMTKSAGEKAARAVHTLRRALEG